MVDASSLPIVPCAGCGGRHIDVESMLRVESLPIAALTGAAYLAPWAKRETEYLYDDANVASYAVDALSIVIAAGMWARFHWPKVRGQEPDITAATRILKQWSEAVNPQARAALESIALEEADSLYESITHPTDLSRDGRQIHVEACALRRDDLASVEWVLIAGGAGDSLSDTLAAVDREARTRLGGIARLSVTESSAERFTEVSWRQPDAWWGSVEEPT
jgi:hypothetical protein